MPRFARWALIGIGALVVLCIVLVLFVPRNTKQAANTAGSASTTVANTGPATVVAQQTTTPAPAAATIPPTAVVTSAPTGAPALATTSVPSVTRTQAPTAQPAAETVKFGKPLTINMGGLSQVFVPVTNTGATVKSFTVKATYKNGDQIAATASGAVNDLLPGQTRAVALVSTDPLRQKTGTVRIDVDTMISDEATTASAEVAKKMKFGPPKASSTAGLSQVEVEVTNGDDKQHSMGVQAIFMKGDTLVGVATGAVNDVGPGQTKTASLIMEGTAQGAEPKVQVDTIVQ